MGLHERITSKSRQTALTGLVISFALAACESELASTTRPCVPDLVDTGVGATGQAYVFSPDPISESALTTLSPTSSQLDNYRRLVSLNRLSGLGVLSGDYVSVRNGLSCQSDFGAYSATQDFRFSQSESGFQEANAYYAGDRFRASLDAAGELIPTGALRVISNCTEEDNAYYVRLITLSTGAITGKVCLGNSQNTPGAYYADDAQVVVHELQHGTTMDSYSLSQGLNALWNDEAGALNEGISDFMALMDAEEETDPSIDVKEFSRWALGKFTPGYSSARGAHRCPSYTTGYPSCPSFGAPGSGGFSSVGKKISYIYPDGMGWPHSGTFTSTNTLASIHANYTSREQIHTSSVIISGTLFEVYQAIKNNHAGDVTIAKRLATQLAIEALKILPKQTSTNVVPVTLVNYATQLRAVAASLLSAGDFTAGDSADLDQVLTERGLYAFSPLPSAWAEVGPGNGSTSPGVRIIDNPAILKPWISEFADSSVVTQTGLKSNNGKINKGEVVAIWFDAKIKSGITMSAGGIKVDVVSPSSNLTMLDWDYNFGGISSSRAQIMYQKIYGSLAVAALNDGSNGSDTGATASYFGTNPTYWYNYRTAIYVKAASSISVDTVVNLQLTLTPANGPATTVTFPVTIYP